MDGTQESQQSQQQRQTQPPALISLESRLRALESTKVVSPEELGIHTEDVDTRFATLENRLRVLESKSAAAPNMADFEQRLTDATTSIAALRSDVEKRVSHLGAK